MKIPPAPSFWEMLVWAGLTAGMVFWYDWKLGAALVFGTCARIHLFNRMKWNETYGKHQDVDKEKLEGK